MIINLTPHPITIRPQDGEEIVIEPTAPAARVAVKSVQVGTIDGIPVMQSEYGAIENLPDPVDGVFYVASMLVAQRAARADVLSPDSGPTAIREHGQIVAVRALVAW